MILSALPSTLERKKADVEDIDRHTEEVILEAAGEFETLTSLLNRLVFHTSSLISSYPRPVN